MTHSQCFTYRSTNTSSDIAWKTSAPPVISGDRETLRVVPRETSSRKWKRWTGWRAGAIFMPEYAGANFTCLEPAALISCSRGTFCSLHSSVRAPPGCPEQPRWHLRLQVNIWDTHTHLYTHTKQGWISERFLSDNVGICCTHSILFYHKSFRLTAGEQNKCHNSASFEILIWVPGNLWLIARLEEIETTIGRQTAVVHLGRQIGRRETERESSFILTHHHKLFLHSNNTLIGVKDVIHWKQNCNDRE